LDVPWRWLLLLAMMFAGLPASTASVVAEKAAGTTPGLAAAPAANGDVTLQVVSARSEPAHPGGAVNKGDVVPTYKYLITIDNTGDPNQPRFPDCSPYFEDPLNPGKPDLNNPNPEYPDKCDWPSIRAMPGGSAIYTQGDEADFAGGASISLPPGKYLVSVQAEEAGYKIGGQHFTVPDAGGPVAVMVALQPHPLPPATLQVQVFEDISPTNGAFDAPAEHGLAGFKANINDILGLVSTDVFGNPLCTTYDAAGNATGQTDCLVSDANGVITVPNLGPNRYDVDVFPPGGSGWIQTTTLEGSIGWDTWLQEGSTGLDNEFVVAGEAFPWTWAGFVQPQNALTDTGISGRVVAASVYVPQNGGLPYYGAQWNGLNGAKITGPITDAWIALADLQNGDTAVYVAPANPDGTFTISHVPDGNYFFTYWDYKLHYIMDWMQVTVSNGQMTDLGTPFLTGWFTWIEGYVFVDSNGNGFRDPGEQGVSDFTLLLKERENTVMDRMTNLVTTDANGYYYFDRAYPLGSWIVLEAYNDRYYTTGVSYKVENQPDWTTVLGGGVDVNVLPILGQTGQIDWGVRSYDPTGVNGPRNGGIVGTVSYDVTRNELDPRYAVIEDWQPGVPNITMQLHAPVACGTNPGTPCDALNRWELAPDGSYATGQLLNEYLTETWQQPTDCIARDADGNPVQQQVLPTSAGKLCLEGPLMGMQFGFFDWQNPDGPSFATVDGNYGFTDGCFGPGGYDPNTQACADSSTPAPLPAGDYLVGMVIPNDAFGRPLYQVTTEEDINIFGGDQFVPAVPPPACAGPLHTVDVAGVGTDGYPEVIMASGAITVPVSTPVNNPSFADGGGSPYEGMVRPSCDTKIVTVSTGRSVAPGFNVFTDVQIPGKWKGYIIDDLNVSVNSQDLFFGEKAPFPLGAVGIYDHVNDLVTTVTSDPNGTYEVLLPSTYSINCPTPSGVCPGTYYLLGNDPGQPGNLNPNYNPQYRTIGATFEIWPGRMLPSDLAPTQIAASILNPASGLTSAARCDLATDTPQLYAVSQPYVNGSGSFSIEGLGFGAAQGTGQVTLDGTIVLPVTSWSDTHIDASIPDGTPVGPHQLKITADNGQSTINGLTFHVLGAGYSPNVHEVGPGRAFATIQAALNAAKAERDASPASPPDELVVVYPDTPALWNPGGIYYENIVINSAVKLQGIGPGGVRPDSTFALGSVIDGGGIVGDTAAAQDWRTLVGSLTWSGNQTVYEGAVVYVLAQDSDFGSAYKPAIDGFSIQGGDQQGFPNFLPGAEPGAAGVVTIQGGGIFANGYARYLQITNNLLKSNGGAYGGAVRLGTPNLPGAANDNQNDFVQIANNRIFANGGTNLAGAVGIFSGAEGYEVAYNDICGNFSAEYGGGISHFGYSPNSAIHHNRIYLNRSYDEGGGVIIAGELPTDPAALSPGAGPVDVYNNLIQANLGNDDGGGLRFLMAGNFPYNVYNNIIANNISTHEGGGISINDAPDVRVYNNTIIKNITTATAQTSNGFPAPAGLSSSRNSATLQASLPPGAAIFSDPVVFNNIFWENRAGSWTGGGVAGIGLAGDPTPVNYWDLGIADGAGLLTPHYSVLQQNLGAYPIGAGATGNQVGVDPQVVLAYDASVSVLPWRGNPNFVDTFIVAVETAPNLMGNYRKLTTSPAVDAGQAASSAVNAPAMDFDQQPRPQGGGYDIGADEFPSGLVPQPPAVTISRSGSDVALSWPAVTLDSGGQPAAVTGYEIHRSTSPYFTPDATTLQGTVPTPGYTDTGVIGSLTNYYYTVLALNASGPSALSNRVGKFEVQLEETTGTDFNWVSLPLDAGLTLASDLKANIEANSSAPLTIGAVQRWNAMGQNYQTYSTVPVPSGDFSLAVGSAYRVSVDITGTPSGTAIWTLLGNVPAPTTFTYNLLETTGTDFNWILLPLDKAALTQASALKTNMDGSASPTAVIRTVQRWNATAQQFASYVTVPVPSGDFPIFIGQPYRVTVDVAAGTTTTWP